MTGGTVSRALERPASAVFHAITHVWGRDYLDTFLNVCIPNQLAPGNVPALPSGSRYRILTRAVHVEELDTHPMVRALRDVIPVDLVVVEALERADASHRGHELMIACHQKAIADILDAGAGIIMLSADFVFSENALAAVVRRHREGYRAVLNTGLRLRKESFRQCLREAEVPLAALSSRELVRRALPHLHPHTESMFADAQHFSTFPVAVYWRLRDEGLLARCFHLHPLMVDPMLPMLLLEGTNDGPYVSQACPDFSRVHVVTDSDEIQMFELTTATRVVVPTGHRAGASTWSAAVVAAKCDRLQLEHWRRRTIVIHTSDLDEKWASAAAVGERFARRALRQRPFARLAKRWFHWAGWMRKRWIRYEKLWYRQRRRVRPERIRRWSERQMRSWNRRRPRVRMKRIQRPVQLWCHRVAKAGRIKLKRIRRVRPFRAASW